MLVDNRVGVSRFTTRFRAGDLRRRIPDPGGILKRVTGIQSSMAKSIIQMLFVLLFAGAPCAFAVPNTVDPADLHATAAQERATTLIRYLIERFHYRDIELDDELSSRIFERYLADLDPNRIYLLASDVEEFSRQRFALDDDIKSAHLAVAFNIFKRVRERATERFNYAISLLDRGFDFSVDEQMMIDRSERPWPANRKTLDEIWRKRVKNDWLTRLLASDSKSEIVDTLTKRYRGLARRVSQLDREDVFQTFINAYVGAIGPHTSYRARRASANFTIHMSLSLEGIGAALASENGYTVVQRVIPGAPADLSNELVAGDRIVGVAQGSGQEASDAMIDIVGWRLADVVGLIRGPKGSVVRLRILPADQPLGGSRHEIRLVRDTVKLKGRAAHSKIYNVPTAAGGVHRIAVIRVPAFYTNLRARARGEEQFRSTTRDVHRILAKLRTQNIDGVVVDLLGDGGGSLPEAIQLTGLFIADGPIVQIRDSHGRIQVSRDPDPNLVYSGPLAVLVDRYSASASEIFAAAIQDYHRGIIIGEPTYGKGTVQRVENLGNGPALGKLTYTIAKFFRIDGDSTQLRGVIPDIVYPTAIDSDNHGERAFDNALEWEAIRPASYELFHGGSLFIPALRALHRARVRDDIGFQYLRSEVKAVVRAGEQEQISLNLSDRREARDRLDRRRLGRLNLYRRSVGEPPLATLTALKKERNSVDPTEISDIRRIKQKEAATIVSDLIRLRDRRLLSDSTAERE